MEYFHSHYYPRQPKARKSCRLYWAKTSIIGECLIGRMLHVDTLEMTFRTFNLRKNPENEITYANRDKIQIRNLEGVCSPYTGAPSTYDKK